MERLVLVLLKLLLQLAWVLFKLALRLVLFVASGDWKKLDKVEAQIREAIEQAKQAEKRPSPQARPASPRAPGTTGRRPPQGPWPFEFAPELTELEPGEEDEGGEHDVEGGEIHGGEWVEPSVIQPTKSFRKVAPRRPPAPPPAARRTRSLRDPETVRDAMVLTAILGPRGRRDRRF